MKKVFFLLLFFSGVIYPQGLKFGEAKGLFMAIGVGPRIPLGNFSDVENIGVGFDVNFSYTDNEFLPVFLYGGIGFQHFPGTQRLYKTSDYSSYSSNVLIFTIGSRYYFKPVFDDVVLLMPVVDAGATFGYFENAHQFKIDSGKQNFVEEKAKLGLHLGAGFSMFILDVMGYYTYLPDNQFLSLDLKIRIPIFVTM